MDKPVNLFFLNGEILICLPISFSCVSGKKKETKSVISFKTLKVGQSKHDKILL